MTMIRIEFQGLPPFKPNPGPGVAGARRRQAAFREAAESQFENWRKETSQPKLFTHPWDPMNAKIGLSINYIRVKGGNDAANIVGGICDALQGVLYADDRQIVKIVYAEESAGEDSEDLLAVEVRVAEVADATQLEQIQLEQETLDNWDLRIGEVWTARAPHPRDSIPGPQAAADAAQVLLASKLSATRYKTLQGLLDDSELLKSEWIRQQNTIIRR